MQSVDPTLLALQVANTATQNAKKKVLPSLTTQAPIQSSLNAPKQQTQAISTNITPPTAKIGGISSPFWATNINSSPVLWWATPNQIQERATQLQSLPKQIPASWAAKKIDVNVIWSLGANVMAGEDLPTIRSKYPEFSNIDDEVLWSVLATMYDWVWPEEILQKFPELQWWGQGSSWLAKIWAIAGDVWLWIAWGIWWLAWLYWAWAASQMVGKGIYWLTLPPLTKEAWALQSYEAGLSKVKPRTVIDTAIESPILQKWDPTKNLQVNLWMFWTRSGIGVQAKARGQQLFEKNINPIFKKADEAGVKFNYSDLKQEAIDSVNNAKKYSVEQKRAIIDDIEWIFDNYKWDTTLENLDLNKKDIANKLPQKYYSWAPMTQTVKDAQWTVASVFRNKVHNYINTNYWVNSSKIYKDYANLQDLAKVWQKSMTQAGLKWWAGSFVSTVLEEVATPVTTTVGKLLYKVWWVAKALPETLFKWAKSWLKSIVKWWKLFTILDDWTLIPWSPSNIASKAVNTPKEDRIMIKGTDQRVHKDWLKYNKDLKMKVVDTDLWYIDEKGNIIQ